VKHVLALDQGTTSSRAILFDENGRLLETAQREFRQIFPQPGWVEHDAREIYETQRDTAREVLRKTEVALKDVMGVGITNQLETTILWDRQTGEPIHNAIVCQDRSTAPQSAELKNSGAENQVRERTGLVIDP
jgi:glycerol kinase